MQKTIHKNRELYAVPSWGKDYFDINEKGNIEIRPGQTEMKIDLFELVQSLVKKGIAAPLLIRFDGILKDRVQNLCAAFQSSIDELKYQNIYQPIFPIKVNPKKHVVETIRKAGSKYSLGLEVGSKAELLASLSFKQYRKTLLLCNGFKDAEYVEIALLAKKLGTRTIIIVEQFEELDLILSTAARLGIDAEIGLRMKLNSQGSGRWKSSGGDRSKFGLSIPEILEAVELLKQTKKSHWLKLFHFHIGSQITSLTSIQKALHEAADMYVEIAKLCPSLTFLDIGGGLAVDYQGTASKADFSLNYTLKEYAHSAVSIIANTCNKASIPHPTLLSESGRAMVAHHSILVAEVLSASYSASEEVNDLYFGNFSIFQSLPDSWALGQIFPVLPISRLNEEVSKRATIVDLTCDSDGKIDRFMQEEKVINVIPLHELDARPYYIGVFLAGAYQEILGTRHNLFGNTSVVHIDFDKTGKWAIKNEVNFSTVKEMLHYVQSCPEQFMKQIHSSIAKQTLTDQESKKIKKHFENALKGHTYLKRKTS